LKREKGVRQEHQPRALGKSTTVKRTTHRIKEATQGKKDIRGWGGGKSLPEEGERGREGQQNLREVQKKNWGGKGCPA